jgi:hypothetical protein
MELDLLDLIVSADDMLYNMLENGNYDQELQAGILEQVENIYNLLDVVGV